MRRSADVPHDAPDPRRPGPEAPSPPVPEASFLLKILWWIGLVIAGVGHLLVVGAASEPVIKPGEMESALVAWLLGFALLGVTGLLANPLAGPFEVGPRCSAEYADALRAAAKHDGMSRASYVYVLALFIAAAMALAVSRVASVPDLAFAVGLTPPPTAAITWLLLALRAPARVAPRDPEDLAPVAALPPPPGASPRYRPLDRDGRTIAAWREALRAMMTRAQGYRSDGIARDEFLRLLEDPRTPVERRVAAAICLSADEDQTTTVRVYAAATSPDERVRVALERGLDGTLTEEELEAAQHTDERHAYDDLDDPP